MSSKNDTNESNQSAQENSKENETGLNQESLKAIKTQVVGVVGYGNPPMETRFQKGQSGNPNGRPKKTADKEQPWHLLPSQNKVLSESKRQIKVREGSQTTEMEVSSALIRSQIATALKGSAFAQKCALDRIEKSEEAEFRRIEELNRMYRNYQAVKWAEIAEAGKQGKPIPEPIPHPDDIVIEDGKEPKFKGPTNEVEAEIVKQNCQFRDILLMQNALDNKNHIEKLGEDILDGPKSARIFAVLLNNHLPERLKISDGEIEARISKHNQTSKRVLLKQLTKGWRKCGIKSRRGFKFPSARTANNRLSFYADFFRAMKSGELDTNAISKGRFDKQTRAFIENRRNLLS